jgi:hypothetical protein
VFAAEVATARPDRDLAPIARPVKYVADVAAVAFAFDSHDYSPFLSGKKPTLRLLGFVVINVFPNGMNGRWLIAEVLTLACLEAGILGRQQTLHCRPRIFSIPDVRF